MRFAYKFRSFWRAFITEDELENYWNTLLSLSGKIENLEEDRKILLNTIKYPSSLFGFRSVSENSLTALQEEWRLVPLDTLEKRECISWQPKSVTIGLRTLEDQKTLIISAAQTAGISEFYQMTINEHDEFVRVPLTV